MATPNKITVGTKDFNLYSSPSSSDSPAVWRYEDPLVAPMFRPTIKQTAKPNSAGTNINSRVAIRVPVVQTVNGTQVSTNSVGVNIEYTSLQNIASDVELTLAADAAIATLTALKANLIAGRTI